MGGLASFLTSLDVDKAYRHVERLTSIAPQRLSGTNEAKLATTYIAEEMRKSGLAVTVYEFDAYVSFPKKCELRVVAPDSYVIEAAVLAQSASTPQEGIMSEVAWVGSGGAGEYADKDAMGKVVLAELSYTPPRPEKVRLAEANGARAVLLMNWGLPEHDSLPFGTVKALWGNPTPETLNSLPGIPAVSIRRTDGEYLRDLMKKGPVKVFLKSECVREWRTIELPFGIARGANDPDKYVLLSGHFDSWAGGVTCNATGNGVMLELARGFSAIRNSLRRSIAVAFWPGHETGIMEGSTWFVDARWDDLKSNCIANINIDSPGLLGATHWSVAAPRETHDFMTLLDEKVIPGKPIIRTGPVKVGDQSFLGIGIPSIDAYTMHDPKVVKQWRGATLGWWYHSWNDTLDKVDRSVLEEDLRTYAAYAYTLADSLLLPFNFGPVVDDIMERLHELETRSPGRFNLQTLMNVCDEAREAVGTIEKISANICSQSGADEAEMLNTTIMKVSRFLSHAIYTVAGRYDHDSYGLTALDSRLPALYLMEDYSERNPDSDAAKLVWTRIIRERNRLSDALEAALDEMRKCVSMLSCI